MKLKPSGWRKFFVLAALEAGAAFFILALGPTHGRCFFLVPFRHAGPALCFFCYMDLFSPFAFQTGSPILSGRFMPWPRHLWPCYWRAPSSSCVTSTPERFLPIYQRLSPLLFYFLVLTIQFSVFILALRYGFHFENLATRKPVYLSALIVFCLFLLTFLFIAVTRIGLIPDQAYWGEPGVPLMGWQLALAILAGLFILLLGLRLPSRSRLDVILPLVLWLLAVVIWLNVPISVMQNSFYAPMNPPTNQPFPNSDAGYYDSMSQSLLMGYPYLGDIPTRPLYVVFLASLHLLAGDRYNLIIAGQTLVLALIPVVLYFLGKKLHSRTAGVVVALFAIFREWTSLLISSQTRVSNTKTLLVDLPTLLLILLACLFALRWLERKDWKSGLLAGGLFGILLLLRTQSMLILPVLFLLVILVYGLRSRGWVVALAFFLIGFAVTIAPWLLHNYIHSGQLTFDAPFEYQVVASQYQYTGNLDIQNVDLQGKGLLGILLTFALKDPKFVFGFIATHFFATQINGLLALPLIEPYNGLFAPLNLYWMTWDGGLSLPNSLLVLIYLAVIAVGFGAVWRRLRWIGLVPLAFSLGYALANGVGRFSGWRYDLPADWISYFYFGIGVAEIFSLSALLFGAQSEKLVTPVSTDLLPASKWSQGLLIVGAFALVGGLPWLAEVRLHLVIWTRRRRNWCSRFRIHLPSRDLASHGAQIEIIYRIAANVLADRACALPSFFYSEPGPGFQSSVACLCSP